MDEWSVYDPSPKNDLLTAESGYFAVVGSEETLVGFACSGIEARVPGLDEEADTLDVGLGMNPTFVGQGHGAEFGKVISDHFHQTIGASQLRAIVQTWNERSFRLALSRGRLFSNSRRNSNSCRNITGFTPCCH